MMIAVGTLLAVSDIPRYELKDAVRRHWFERAAHVSDVRVLGFDRLWSVRTESVGGRSRHDSLEPAGGVDQTGMFVKRFDHEDRAKWETFELIPEELVGFRHVHHFVQDAPGFDAGCWPDCVEGKPLPGKTDVRRPDPRRQSVKTDRS